MKISKEIQISILETVLTNFDKWYYSNGTCGLICRAYEELTDIYVGTDNVTNILIPSFNVRKALKLAKKHEFELPHLENDYWWEPRDRENRKLFLTYLIQELKEKQ